MNEIVNKFVLAGDKFIPEMHLKQPGFPYSVCGPFTKNKERIQKFKETGDTNYIYKNEFDKACFQHDTAYGDFKDLARRTTSDKVSRDKAGLASMVYKFFDKKSAGSSVANNEIKQNMQLAEELHKPVIRNFRKRKIYSEFKDNIWDADLADMQLISKLNKRFRFLLCVFRTFSKYAWVVPLKHKRGITITNAFQKILKESNRKPNKI